MRGPIFVTGGSGFVGSSVLDALQAADFSVNALVRHEPLDRPSDRVISFTGGLFDDAALDAGMKGCTAVIHLVGIIAERPAEGITFDRIHYQGTQHVVDATKRAGIRRYIQMSAIGARPDAPATYHRTKFLAEQYVRDSGLDWTIIRPSIIHGPRGDFMKTEAGWARGTSVPYLFMPYFGRGLLGLGGAGKLQPVFVEDVARAFVECLDDPQKARELFCIGGPDQMTWPGMHRMIAQVLVGHRRPVLAIPDWYAKSLAAIVPPGLLPFSRDQVLMSEEDNICDLSTFVSAFGWTPRSFEQMLCGYAAELKA
jgi:nucleoside-diphosphate-sugar epimerase